MSEPRWIALVVALGGATLTCQGTEQTSAKDDGYVDPLATTLIPPSACMLYGGGCETETETQVPSDVGERLDLHAAIFNRLYKDQDIIGGNLDYRVRGAWNADLEAVVLDTLSAIVELQRGVPIEGVRLPDLSRFEVPVGHITDLLRTRSVESKSIGRLRQPLRTPFVPACGVPCDIQVLENTIHTASATNIYETLLGAVLGDAADVIAECVIERCSPEDFLYATGRLIITRGGSPIAVGLFAVADLALRLHEEFSNFVTERMTCRAHQSSDKCTEPEAGMMQCEGKDCETKEGSPAPTTCGGAGEVLCTEPCPDDIKQSCQVCRNVLGSDPLSCGSCIGTCGLREVCQGGVCVDSGITTTIPYTAPDISRTGCPLSETFCPGGNFCSVRFNGVCGECTDLATDENNCGGCIAYCSGTCVSGACSTGTVGNSCTDASNCISVEVRFPTTGLCSGFMAVTATNNCDATLEVAIQPVGCSALGGKSTLSPGEVWSCGAGNYYNSSCTNVQYKAALTTDPISCTQF